MVVSSLVRIAHLALTLYFFVLTTGDRSLEDRCYPPVSTPTTSGSIDFENSTPARLREVLMAAVGLAAAEGDAARRQAGATVAAPDGHHLLGPKPRGKPAPGHKVHPYLLRELVNRHKYAWLN
jgi:hypothetical protein